MLLFPAASWFHKSSASGNTVCRSKRPASTEPLDPTKTILELKTVKDIRALQRGLEVLRLLNVHNGSTLSNIVRLANLPKSTTYRILHNLCSAGYVERDSQDSRYRLTPLVLRLSGGYEESQWITEVAKPLIHELGRKVIYPITISTIYGLEMLVRDTTSSESAMSLDYYGVGTTIPLFYSSSGKTYLAFCRDESRETILAACQKSGHPDHAMAKDREMINLMLRRIREDGYAFDFRSPRPKAAGKMSTICVPILGDTDLIGSLAMRYIDSAVSSSEVVQNYLPILKKYAEKISAGVHQLDAI